MNYFEAIFLISPDVANSDIENICSKFENSVTKEGGKITGKEDWGLRDLAYNIKNLKKAFYNYYQIEIDKNKLPILKKNLSVNEKIIRQIFIKVNEHEELPTQLINKQTNER